jgi:DNA-binding transcriptional ArsR family regulator
LLAARRRRNPQPGRLRYLRKIFIFFQKSCCVDKWLRVMCSQVATEMNLRRDVFQAIADPTRRAILLLVASQAMTAGAIAANFDTARPTVSKHLAILTECELLKPEQDGREIYYHLNPEKMREVADFIEPFRAMWEERFNKLESVMKNYRSKK